MRTTSIPLASSEAIKTLSGDREDLLSEYRRWGDLLPKFYGAKGGFITWMVHGPEHMSRIATNGWTGDARKKRLHKHQRSIAKARAVLKEIRESKKRFGAEWVIGRFRENLHKSGDPKAALRKILDGA
jgi:hypothetical protein